MTRDRSLGGPGDVLFVPVAIFWGRSPQRENSLLELFASEDWGLAGRLRRFFALLVHGRAVLVKVGEPISVAAAMAAAGWPEKLGAVASRRYEPSIINSPCARLSTRLTR